MAFPTIVNSAIHEDSTLASGTDVTLPASIVAGNLLLMHFRTGRNSTVIAPTGWEDITTPSASGYTGLDSASSVWLARVADASEGATVRVTWSSSDTLESAAITYQISGWEGSIADGVKGVFATTNTIDPPSLSTGLASAQDILWFASVSSRATEWSVTTPPTNYSDPALYARSRNYTSTNSVACSLAVSHRELNATTEDPGTWTLSGVTSTPVASTIAVLSTSVRPGVTITGIKEPNQTDTLVASVASPRIKVWSGTDDSGAENLLFDNEDAIYPITNGELEVPLPSYNVNDVVTIEVLWTVGTEIKMFITEETVIDLEVGT